MRHRGLGVDANSTLAISGASEVASRGYTFGDVVNHAIQAYHGMKLNETAVLFTLAAEAGLESAQYNLVWLYETVFEQEPALIQRYLHLSSKVRTFVVLS